MVSQLSDDTDWGDINEDGGAMSNPMEKLAELEARMALGDSRQDASIDELRKEFKDLKEKIAELLEALQAVKGAIKIVSYAERAIVWFAKVGGSIGLLYAAYKFGLTELAKEVKDIGR